MVLINVTSLYGKTSAIDSVDGSSTGIAMCQIAFLLRDAESLLMATIGHPRAVSQCLLCPQLRTFQKTLGPEHPNVAQSLNNLAELYRAQGRYGEAELGR